MMQKMDFSDIMASTIHDTKNSMGMLFNTLEEIMGRCDGKDCEAYRGFSMLQYEIKRLNSNLIRLLALYKDSREQFQVRVDYHAVSEFLEDILIQNEPVLQAQGIAVELDCPDDLYWTFDRELLAGVLDNILNNAFRYAKGRIRIAAGEENGYLALRLDDDGEGYPENMLMGKEGQYEPPQGVSFNTGSTGLGLYFALLVARSHQAGGRNGTIVVGNGGTYGGGVFTVYLP